jgi:hypothetical protein
VLILTPLVFACSFDEEAVVTAEFAEISKGTKESQASAVPDETRAGEYTLFFRTRDPLAEVRLVAANQELVLEQVPSSQTEWYAFRLHEALKLKVGAEVQIVGKDDKTTPHIALFVAEEDKDRLVLRFKDRPSEPIAMAALELGERRPRFPKRHNASDARALVATYLALLDKPADADAMRAVVRPENLVGMIPGTRLEPGDVLAWTRGSKILYRYTAQSSMYLDGAEIKYSVVEKLDGSYARLLHKSPVARDFAIPATTVGIIRVYRP